MSTQIDELYIKLSADINNFEKSMLKAQNVNNKSLSNMEKQLQSFAASSKQNTSFATQAWSSFAGFLGGQVVVGAFNLVGGAARKLFDLFVNEGVKGALAQEDAINRLNISLKASGQFSQETSKDLQVFASSLQATTRFGDDVVLKNAALIQSLGQLDKEGLKKATQAAIDMSAALGIDLTAAATLVGKAATGEISSFTRYGLVIEKGANASQTFANALDAISTKFGGAASQDVLTFSGRVDQLKNNFGDLGEEFFLAATKNDTLNQFMGRLNDIVVAATPRVAELADKLIKLLIPSEEDKLGGEIDLVVMKIAGLEAQVERFKDGGLLGKLLGGNARERLVEQQTILDELSKKQEEFMFARVEREQAVQQKLDADNAKAAEDKRLRDAENAAIEKENQLLKQEEALLSLGEFFQTKNEMLDAQFKIEKKKLDDALTTEFKGTDKHKAAILALEKKHKEEKKKLDETEFALKIKNRADDLKFAADTSNGLAQVAMLGGRKTFGITKRLMQAQALASAGAAAALALANPPGPPWTIPIAAGAFAQGMMRVQQIESTGFQKGIDSIPGTGFGDKFPAMLAPKETVLRAGTGETLTPMIQAIHQAIMMMANQQPTAAPGVGGVVEISLADNAIDIIRARFIEQDVLGISAAG